MRHSIPVNRFDIRMLLKKKTCEGNRKIIGRTKLIMLFFNFIHTFAPNYESGEYYYQLY